MHATAAADFHHRLDGILERRNDITTAVDQLVHRCGLQASIRPRPGKDRGNINLRLDRLRAKCKRVDGNNDIRDRQRANEADLVRCRIHGGHPALLHG